jgi:hypothetical protein
MKTILVVLLFLVAGTAAHAQEPMDERGEQGMGFSQTTTNHHFLMNARGGIVQVEVNDPADTASRTAIRMHLQHIARMFQAGDFDMPMFVHDTVPPGVPEMKKLQKNIRYNFGRPPMVAGWSCHLATRTRSMRFIAFCISKLSNTIPATARNRFKS